MLEGRLGLDKSDVRHASRHGVMYLDMGALSSDRGNLIFTTSSSVVTIPVQTVSAILLGPGGSVTQDALRLLAFYGAALVATGSDGVRRYTAPPLSSSRSGLARQHATLWCDPDAKLRAARRLYAWRFGEVLPHRDLNVLRGIEGGRVKKGYKNEALRFGIMWEGRRYDRANPAGADLANQAINHASSAVEAAAAIATIAAGAIPQLGFIHEDPGESFVLDIADLYRFSVTVPCAFRAVRSSLSGEGTLEMLTRRGTGRVLSKDNIIDDMIGKIKALIENSADYKKEGRDVEQKNSDGWA